MELNRPLFIPVILGTVRKGRMSQFGARLVHSEIARRPGVETELIDRPRGRPVGLELRF